MKQEHNTTPAFDLSKGSELPERNIVFLDVDGVLLPNWEQVRVRSYQALSRLIKDYQTYLNRGLPDYRLSAILDFDQGAVDRVIQLCEECNARIVVISSWRTDLYPPQLKLLFSLCGLGKYIEGKIEDGASRYRNDDIIDWLKTAHNVIGHVIIDDVNAGFDLKHFVECDDTEGFTSACFEKATNILLKNAAENLTKVRCATI